MKEKYTKTEYKTDTTSTTFFEVANKIMLYDEKKLGDGEQIGKLPSVDKSN